MEEMLKYKKASDTLRITQLIIRFISSLSIFAVTVFFTPNFQITSFPILIISSIVITLLDYLMSIVTGIHDIPIGRGFVGFISAKINIVFFAYLCASLIFLVFIAIARFSSSFRNLVKPCKTPFVNNKLITNYFFLFIQLNSSITPFLYTLYVYFGKICNNMISSKFIISIFSLLFIWDISL